MQPALNADFALALLPAQMDANIDRLADAARKDLAAHCEHVRRCFGQKVRRTRERMEREHGH